MALFRKPKSSLQDVSKAVVPRSGGPAVARDVTSMVRAMTGYDGDLDIAADGAPLMRPEAWQRSKFGPMWPLSPDPLDLPRPDSGQPDPRIFQYPFAYNLQYFNDRPVGWEILRKAADSPLFRACIELRKTEVSTLNWTFGLNAQAVEAIARQSRKAPQDVANELREKYRNDIDRLNNFWSAPDRKNGRDFAEWISILFEEQLVWDALAVYPQMTYGGDVLNFKIIDGSTIKPLLDEEGGRPLPPAVAYQQILYGFPRGEYTADTVDIDGDKVTPSGLTAAQLIYKRRVVRNRSPYGMSPTEQALLHGMLYNARFRWMLSEYTEGTQPMGYLVNKDPAANDWDPRQILEYERAYNDRFSGQTAERFRNAVLPPGFEPHIPPGIPERYKSDYDLHLVRLVAMHYGETITELGFTEPGGLGSAGYHEGQADIQFRKGRLPDIRYASRFITSLSRTFLGAPDIVEHQFLGLIDEDEAAADAVEKSRTDNGRMTLNEARADRGLPAYDFSEADEPMLMTARGVVFLRGASRQAPPGILIEPASEQEGENSPQGSSPTARRPIGAVKPGAAAKAVDPGSEVLIYRRWAEKHPGPARKFRCEYLSESMAEAIAPDLLDDPRIEFWKAAPAGGAPPKALGSSGRPGNGILSFSPYSRLP